MAIETSAAQVEEIYKKQRAFAPSLKKTKAGKRIAKLDKIFKYLDTEKNQIALKRVLATDLGKPEVEAMTSEISILFASIKDIKSKLRTWMSDKSVSTPMTFLGASSRIHYEPKGVALIISPWNYPFQLCINPLLYAIAAGCTAVLKPSEFSENTSAFIQQMIGELFDEKEVAVCQGGIPTSQALLSKPFDHMYFTGSPTVGKIVMGAAAKHLSSVTLELGGKSPCFIDSKNNLTKVAKKLTWGKFFNCGQTCIAPDYILIDNKVKDKFISEVSKQIQSNYNADGKGIKNSPDLGRIINEKHFSKLQSLVSDAISKGAEVAVGGDSDLATKYIEPTILSEVSQDMDIMQEEIFGPVLPIIGYNTLEEAIQIVNSKPKPLALYALSSSNAYIKKIINSTSAGGTVINDFLIHFANHNLPFGGVNNSGIGKSHGKYGFLAFSNERGVMKNRWAATDLMHPPYTNFSKKLSKVLGRWV